ncbi:MAG TPA: hypothetical protein VHN77_03235 [Phycisphaerales bacterium]|nr:hypothetical protein [Phycisphaerales bacterium]
MDERDPLVAELDAWGADVAGVDAGPVPVGVRDAVRTAGKGERSVRVRSGLAWLAAAAAVVVVAIIAARPVGPRPRATVVQGDGQGEVAPVRLVQPTMAVLMRANAGFDPDRLELLEGGGGAVGRVYTPRDAAEELGRM